MANCVAVVYYDGTEAPAVNSHIVPWNNLAALEDKEFLIVHVQHLQSNGTNTVKFYGNDGVITLKNTRSGLLVRQLYYDPQQKIKQTLFNLNGSQELNRFLPVETWDFAAQDKDAILFPFDVNDVSYSRAVGFAENVDVGSCV